MSFFIIRNDITQMETVAIVNAANERLKEGGGVCGAIFSAAGREKLQKECDKIGCLKTGEAVITKGYDLKAKYIIHTVGPVYGQDRKNEEKQLYSCYKNSLEICKRKHISSVAFPVISSGIYGYPKAEAIKIATRAIKEFLAENEMTVFLVVYDNSTFTISEKLFNDVKSYIAEREVKKDTRNRQDELFETVTVDAFTDSSSKSEESELDILEKSSPKRLCCPSASCQNSYEVKKTKQSSKLKKMRSLEELLSVKPETFSELLFKMIDKKGMTDVEVYKGANIDRKLFSKIRKVDYVPKKMTVLALIISLKLNMEEAKELLERAGFAFSISNKTDLIIEYFIENGNYDIFEINETLFAFNEQCLGG